MKVPWKKDPSKDDKGHCRKHTKKRKVDSITTFHKDGTWTQDAMWTCKKCKIPFFAIVTTGKTRPKEN
jgi:hypothetical protein